MPNAECQERSSVSASGFGIWHLTSGIYLAAALLWTWPLPLHLANRFTHDPGDPLLVTYLIWWNAHAIPFTQAWWNAPFFWPAPDALALTEHMAGLSPITTPIQWLGGSPLLAYNIVLMASIWWTLLATHALVRRLTGDHVAAACAAIAFTFAPYRSAQLGHLQLYACWWMPLSLLGLHAYLAEGRRRWLLVFGVSWLMQALTNGYSLFHLPLVFAGWVAWFTPWRTNARRAVAIGGAWLAASLPLVPVLLHYYEVQKRLGLTRDRGEMIFYSAGWTSFLAVAPIMRFWKRFEPSTSEGYLFPGVTVVALIAAAILWRLRSRAFWFYVTAALMAAWLCAGPSLDGFSLATLLHPYDLLLWLPGYSSIRVPPRFFMIAALCLAVAAGLALAHLRSRRVPAFVVWLVFAGLAVDGAITGMPLGRPPGRLPILDRGARILSLPFDDAPLAVTVAYRAMAQQVPVVNGYAGYIPPHAGVIEWALWRHDPSILTELRRGHPLYVLAGTEAWNTFMNDQNDARIVQVVDGGRLYEMSPAPYRQEISVGAALTAATVEAQTDWLVADLGRETSVRALDLRTRGHVIRLPGSVRIDTSLDGSHWSVAADERPGGAALLGVLAEPRVVPIRLFLPDPRARYVRINTPFFGPAAITIYGP